MSRRAARLSFAALALLAAAERPALAECERAGDEIVVKALRFSDGRSYSFRVINNGTSPIYNLTIGRGAFIEASYDVEPASVGSPSGWKYTYVLGQDPRLPGSHSHTLTSYLWAALKSPEAWIQPGRSLSGFSIQLPTPREASLAFWKSIGTPEQPTEQSLARMEARLAPQPDLTKLPFDVLRSGGRCVVGTIELDSGSDADDAQPHSGS